MPGETTHPEAPKVPQRGFESHPGSPWTILLTLPAPQIWRKWLLLPAGDSSKCPAEISLAPHNPLLSQSCAPAQSYLIPRTFREAAHPGSWHSPLNVRSKSTQDLMANSLLESTHPLHLLVPHPQPRVVRESNTQPSRQQSQMKRQQAQDAESSLEMANFWLVLTPPLLPVELDAQPCHL